MQSRPAHGKIWTKRVEYNYTRSQNVPIKTWTRKARLILGKTKVGSSLGILGRCWLHLSWILHHQVFPWRRHPARLCVQCLAFKKGWCLQKLSKLQNWPSRTMSNHILINRTGPSISKANHHWLYFKATQYANLVSGRASQPRAFKPSALQEGRQTFWMLGAE